MTDEKENQEVNIVPSAVKKIEQEKKNQLQKQKQEEDLEYLEDELDDYSYDLVKKAMKK